MYAVLTSPYWLGNSDLASQGNVGCRATPHTFTYGMHTWDTEVYHKFNTYLNLVALETSPLTKMFLFTKDFILTS